MLKRGALIFDRKFHFLFLQMELIHSGFMVGKWRLAVNLILWRAGCELWFLSTLRLSTVLFPCAMKPPPSEALNLSCLVLFHVDQFYIVYTAWIPLSTQSGKYFKSNIWLMGTRIYYLLSVTLDLVSIVLIVINHENITSL